MVIVDGKKIAREIIKKLKQLPSPSKKLAAIFIGDNPSSASFLKQKQKTAQKLNADFELIRLKESISADDLRFRIKKLNEDPSIGGLIIQLPLPQKFKQQEIISTLSPKKDVDALVYGSSVLPLSVEVIKDVMKETNFNSANKIVGIIGRGILIGKPAAEWFSGKCREVIIFASKTGLSRIKNCDLIICGAGKADLIKPSNLKPGAGVIDFGFSVVDGKIHGDFDSQSLINGNVSPSFYTPTPGGTGPILVAELFKNFYKLAV